ncbi:MAG TPA: dihydrofolate reductase [Xanthobacteraceae bacterium]|nr:dihydrofolate reductase [Xanthobacteraceae bacterium]
MSAKVPRLVLVAAVAENGVIGRNNALPWRIKSDLARFRARTMGKPVVMGRKTFLSIGKPLDGRTNIVVSRTPGFAAPGIVVASSLEKALLAARGDALRRGVDEIMVIGGSEIFSQAMPLADSLEITSVHARPEGDVYFPPIDPRIWQETVRREHPAGPQDEAAYTEITYVRA